MKCIAPEEGQIILQDVHVGVYRSHAGAKALMGKTYWQGFFWLIAVSNANSIIHRCEGCQFFAR
jgi:transposase InsO family protein